MRLPLFLLLVPVSLGCGEIELEGPEQEPPAPLCIPSEQFDPETGECEPRPCVWDEDCKEDLRCDRIEGVCRAEE